MSYKKRSYYCRNCCRPTAHVTDTWDDTNILVAALLFTFWIYIFFVLNGRQWTCEECGTMERHGGLSDISVKTVLYIAIFPVVAVSIITFAVFVLPSLLPSQPEEVIEKPPKQEIVQLEPDEIARRQSDADCLHAFEYITNRTAKIHAVAKDFPLSREEWEAAAVELADIYPEVPSITVRFFEVDAAAVSDKNNLADNLSVDWLCSAVVSGGKVNFFSVGVDPQTGEKRTDVLTP